MANNLIPMNQIPEEFRAHLSKLISSASDVTFECIDHPRKICKPEIKADYTGVSISFEWGEEYYRALAIRIKK